MRVGEVAFAMLCLGLPSFAIAGPFGIDVVGFNVSQYSCTELGGQLYTCTSIPKPHNAFESYTLRYHADAGLCSIVAIGKDIRENGFGTQTKKMVESLYEQVSKKYGDVEKGDILLSTSIWNEPDEWLMGIMQKERVYNYIGDVEPPIEEIKKYGVMALATSSDVGYVVVEFHTVNYEKCEEAETRDGASSF